MQTHRLEIRLTLDELAAVDALAGQNGIARAQVVIDALRPYLLEQGYMLVEKRPTWGGRRVPDDVTEELRRLREG
jgi:hypothetical protein